MGTPPATQRAGQKRTVAVAGGGVLRGSARAAALLELQSRRTSWARHVVGVVAHAKLLQAVLESPDRGGWAEGRRVDKRRGVVTCLRGGVFVTLVTRNN